VPSRTPLVARQRCSKYISAAVNQRVAEQRLCRADDYLTVKQAGFPRISASRRRRQKESLRSETVIYGHESQESRTPERRRWQGPAACAKDKSDLSSETVTSKNKE
jgi:hypothetical protein